MTRKRERVVSAERTRPACLVSASRRNELSRGAVVTERLGTPKESSRPDFAGYESARDSHFSPCRHAFAQTPGKRSFTFEDFTTLQRLKVPSKMLSFPDEGHWVLKRQNSRLWYKTVNDWVDQ
jgi:hypothetical protein